MIDAVTAFFAGIATAYLLTWPGIFGLIILGIIFEHSEMRGWAVFTAIVTSIVAYFFFAVPLAEIAMYALAYVIVGVLWSFWRYKRFVSEKVAEIKERWIDPDRRAAKAEELHPAKNLDTITAWILIWPFSLIDNIAGDLITTIQTLVKSVFRGVYYKIYDRAIADLK